jgi:hypothetical protein
MHGVGTDEKGQRRFIANQILKDSAGGFAERPLDLMKESGLWPHETVRKRRLSLQVVKDSAYSYLFQNHLAQETKIVS